MLEEIGGVKYIMKIFISPTGALTTPYGIHDSKHVDHIHRGLDFACKPSDEIHSPIDGVVSKIVAQGDTGLGNGVYVKTSEGYRFIFGHLSEVKVRLHELLQVGDVIGMCGSTGRSFGSHLHFAAKNPSGHYINPQYALELVHTLKTALSNIFDFIT